MQSNNQQSVLENLWAEHREFLKRLLISLCRDVDLAEDLLQETFVRASGGIAGYRGGDARAWLAAIAKNAFRTHLRRRYVVAEAQMDLESAGATEPHQRDLNLLAIKEAVSALPPALRTALTMKHYGGYTYEEIARRVGCPVGTAKSRVCLALKRLRNALAAEREEVDGMLCEDITDRILMDFIYGKAEGKTVAAVRKHLRGCRSCSEKAAQVGRVLHALDAVEAASKSAAIVEIEQDGSYVEYISIGFVQPPGEPMGNIEFGAGADDRLTYVSVQGEVIPVEPTGERSEDGQVKYRGTLTKPVNPGDVLDLLFVNRPETSFPRERLSDDLWRLGPGKLHTTDDMAYTLAVRLPPGAGLVKAAPEPSLTHENAAVTVYWEGVLPAEQRSEFWIDYRMPSEKGAA